MNIINYNYWKTKDKQIVKITDMSAGHLINTIDIIENKWLPKLKKEFQEYQISFHSKTWDDPFPFDDVRDLFPKYGVLENYVKTMKLELTSRKV